jgi:hypothetical protein
MQGCQSQRGHSLPLSPCARAGLLKHFTPFLRERSVQWGLKLKPEWWVAYCVGRPCDAVIGRCCDSKQNKEKRKTEERDAQAPQFTLNLGGVVGVSGRDEHRILNIY